jgi:hypothetical protein
LNEDNKTNEKNDIKSDEIKTQREIDFNKKKELPKIPSKKNINENISNNQDNKIKEILKLKEEEELLNNEIKNLEEDLKKENNQKLKKLLSTTNNALNQLNNFENEDYNYTKSFINQLNDNFIDTEETQEEKLQKKLNKFKKKNDIITKTYCNKSIIESHNSFIKEYELIKLKKEYTTTDFICEILKKNKIDDSHKHYCLKAEYENNFYYFYGDILFIDYFYINDFFDKLEKNDEFISFELIFKKDIDYDDNTFINKLK